MKQKKIIAISVIAIIGLFIFGSVKKIVSKKTVSSSVNYWASSKIKGANIYVSNNANSTVLAMLNKVGVPLFVFNCDKQWCHVQLLEGTKGYIKKIAVSKQITSIVKTETDLYNLPNGKKILATFYPNVLVMLMHKNNGWCFVNKHNLRGYVRCEKLLGGQELMTP